MQYPPPQLSERVLNPDGEWQKVRAYTGTGRQRRQRLTWDGDEGQWVVDHTVARWVRNKDKQTGEPVWVLASINVPSKQAPRQLIQRIEKLEESVLLQAEVIMTLGEFILTDGTGITPEQFREALGHESPEAAVAEYLKLLGE